ncbi:MAG TPA: PLDc N-terminal domain-containing protein [Propionibacteriaceae bacterium]
MILYLIELTIKIVALGKIPGNRRPSSSIAWLLLIVVTPILGLVIFLLIGSPFVRGRRAKVQAEANKLITERTAEIPDVPPGADIPVGVDSLFRLNRRLRIGRISTSRSAARSSRSWRPSSPWIGTPRQVSGWALNLSS